ncbi:MAG: pyridoxamine 5'-phosphate oxidase family protein [Saccharofermentanales bacterium]|jgi:nitroimidazol reductase NimA-like FMN-containing flavoprotein (pyridoxamine 5'-phosphate oxidase superfamily)
MRRKDRERDRAFALQVMDDAAFGVLGLFDRATDEPYTLPLSIVRDGDALYFHSAQAGRKVDLIEDGMTVSVTFVSHHHVPACLSHDEVRDMLDAGSERKVLSKVFTTEFASAHVVGTLHPVTDVAEKKHALQLVCDKYTPDVADLAKTVIEQSHTYTAVYRIDMRSIAGKAKTVTADDIERVLKA